MLKKLALVLIFTCLANVGAMDDDERNPDIKKLDLSNDRQLFNIDFLRFFPQLEKLNLSNTVIGDNYVPVGRLHFLKKLDMHGVILTNTSHLSSLKNLECLNIACSSIEEAVQHINVEHLPKLKSLSIYSSYVGLENLGKMKNLEKLTIRHVLNEISEDSEYDETTIPSLNFLKKLKHLVYLDVSANDYLFYVKPITALKKLKILDISACRNIKDLEKIKKITSLVSLKMSCLDDNCIPGFTKSLVFLNELTNLKYLEVERKISLPSFDKKIKIEFP